MGDSTWSIECSSFKSTWGLLGHNGRGLQGDDVAIWVREPKRRGPRHVLDLVGQFHIPIAQRVAGGSNVRALEHHRRTTGLGVAFAGGQGE